MVLPEGSLSFVGMVFPEGRVRCADMVLLEGRVWCVGMVLLESCCCLVLVASCRRVSELKLGYKEFGRKSRHAYYTNTRT